MRSYDEHSSISVQSSTTGSQNGAHCSFAGSQSEWVGRIARTTSHYIPSEPSFRTRESRAWPLSHGGETVQCTSPTGAQKFAKMSMPRRLNDWRTISQNGVSRIASEL